MVGLPSVKPCRAAPASAAAARREGTAPHPPCSLAPALGCTLRKVVNAPVFASSSGTDFTEWASSEPFFHLLGRRLGSAVGSALQQEKCRGLLPVHRPRQPAGAAAHGSPRGNPAVGPSEVLLIGAAGLPMPWAAPPASRPPQHNALFCGPVRRRRPAFRRAASPRSHHLSRPCSARLGALVVVFSDGGCRGARQRTRSPRRCVASQCRSVAALTSSRPEPVRCNLTRR